VRWLRPDALRWLRPDCRRCMRPGVEHPLVLALQEKANFDPNQPRVPRGHPRGGQWTGGDANGLSDGGERIGESETAGEEPGGRAPLRITIYPRDIVEAAGPASDGPTFELARDFLPLDLFLHERPPHIPERRPPAARLRTRVVKQVAQWAARTALRAPLGPVGAVITIAEVATWLHESYPYIQAYQDPPKPLVELRRAAAVRKTGYDVHHIVERAAAATSGFPREMIDGPDNRARIPTLKHWQITGWYMTRNEDFGGLTPRAYLVGKDWAEHVRVGKLALARFGVMKQ
jgi:hypothetical protein